MHDRVKILSVAAVSVCFALLSGTLISLGQQYPEGTLQVAQGSLAPDQTVATVTPNSELRYPVSQPLVDDLEETDELPGSRIAALKHLLSEMFGESAKVREATNRFLMAIEGAGNSEDTKGKSSGESLNSD